MIVFENATLFKSFKEGDDSIEIDGGLYTCVVGKHSVWVPFYEMKLIWSHNGRIESFRDWDKGRNKEKIEDGTFSRSEEWNRYSMRSIIDEWTIMNMLAGAGVAPPVGALVYVKKFISYYPYGVEFCDVYGRYGYQMKNAEKLDRGRFERGCLKKILGNKLVISDGAIGDVYKEDNIINGYLVDIRRTLWDMMTLDVEYSEEFYDTVTYKYDVKEIEEKVATLGQFPFKERKKPYQDYYLMGEYREGSRDTRYRMNLMGLHRSEVSGKSVLDIGCAIGSMATEAHRRGARKILGFDSQAEYIECARDVAAANRFPINYVKMDLMNTAEVAAYISKFFCEGPVDIVLALSLFKHVKFKMFDLLREFDWKVCFIESNNAPAELETDHVKQIVKGIYRMKEEFYPNLMIDYLGQTGDRSPRCVWRIEGGDGR